MSKLREAARRMELRDVLDSQRRLEERAFSLFQALLTGDTEWSVEDAHELAWKGAIMFHSEAVDRQQSVMEAYEREALEALDKALEEADE